MDYKKECDKEYLKHYLEKIRTKNGYKRVSLSPLRYAGGKSLAIGYILENIPNLQEKKIVSPFFGGGSLELVLAKELGYTIIGYDIFEILVNFWKQIIQKPLEFSNELSKLIPGDENFTKNRHILLHYWEKYKPNNLEYKTKKKVELTDNEKNMLDNNNLLRAVYYYYNMQLSYGPMFLGWKSSVYTNKEKFDKIVENIKNFSIRNLSVECETFENVLDKHKNDFLFLDPPYYLGEDSRMFKGMYPNCNFAIHHNNFNHKLLCDKLKEHRGGFLITYNECETIKEWYKDYIQIFPQWQYTFGQGEKRIGKNREEKRKDNIKESHEIMIISLPS